MSRYRAATASPGTAPLAPLVLGDIDQLQT
jgi:hypothetical protein